MAFFELLLATPVWIAVEHQGRARLMQLDNGQLAVPVFLDEDSLHRWEPSAVGRECSLPAAAQLAVASENTWLIVDPGTQPGHQIVGRATVELLARGTHPLAATSGERHDLVCDFVAAVGAGRIDPALITRAQTTHVVSLAPDRAVTAPGPPPKLELASVAGPDGTSLCPVWPTMAGSFVFKPGPAQRVVILLAGLIKTAAGSGRGLLVQIAGESITVPAAALATLWK